MDRSTVLKAWRDEAFRESLTEQERAALPQAPENMERLSEAQMEEAAGGVTPTLYVVATAINAAGLAGAGALVYDKYTDDPNGPG